MSPTELAHAPSPAGIAGAVREAPHLARILLVLARHDVRGAPSATPPDASGRLYVAASAHAFPTGRTRVVHLLLAEPDADGRCVQRRTRAHRSVPRPCPGA